jgi:hypothetical protein
MMEPDYYREQAGRARRLAQGIGRADVVRQLHDMAQDYEEIAADLESGAVGIRHPELLSPKQRGTG